MGRFGPDQLYDRLYRRYRALDVGGADVVVRNESQGARGSHGDRHDQDILRTQFLDEFIDGDHLRVDMQQHDVALHLVGIDGEPVPTCQTFCQALCVRVIV